MEPNRDCEGAADTPGATQNSPANQISRGASTPKDTIRPQIRTKGVWIMPRIFAPIGLLLWLSPLIFGQASPGQAAPGEPNQPLPAFDLADVHQNRQTQTLLTSGTRGAVVRASGRYEFVNATILDLVRTAYNVEADKVLGGPSW